MGSALSVSAVTGLVVSVRSLSLRAPASVARLHGAEPRAHELHVLLRHAAAAAAADLLERLDRLLAVDDLAEDGVLPVELLRAVEADEELRPARVRVGGAGRREPPEGVRVLRVRRE